MNMNKRVILILCISSLCLPAVHAQTEQKATGAEAVMTLHDCMEYAVSHSTQVLIQKTRTGDARLDRRTAILAAFTPSIDGNVYGSYSWGRTPDPETNVNVTTTTFKNYWSVNAGINVFDGFAAVNNMKIAKTSLAVGYTQENWEEDKVCLATIEAYFNVLYYNELSRILEVQVENARSAVTLAARQEELGTKGHADVVQMEADLADKEYELTSARNSYDDALITLEDVMFWPPDKKLAVNTDISAIEAEGFEPLSAEDVIDRAVTTHPSVSVAKGTMENASRSLHTAKWQYLPTLALNGGWSTDYHSYPGQTDFTPSPYWNQFNENGAEYVQLSLRIPIFDRLSKVTNLSKKKNEYSRASLDYEKALRDVESEVRRAVQARNGALSEMQQAGKRADVQEEALHLNTRKFEQGLISSLDYNTASGNYLHARAVYLHAQLKYQLKHRIVNYYNGIRYIDQK